MDSNQPEAINPPPIPFDISAFSREKYEPREAEISFKIPVPGSGSPEPVEQVFVVKGLTAEELAKIDQIVDNNKNLQALLDAVVRADSGDIKARLDAIKDLAGMSNDVPASHVKKLAIFRAGCVNPEFGQADAVKFAKVHPIEFIIISNKIYELTGLGQQVKKKR